MAEGGAMLSGRVTYETSYWPAVARGDAEAPPATREWAVKLEANPLTRANERGCMRSPAGRAGVTRHSTAGGPSGTRRILPGMDELTGALDDLRARVSGAGRPELLPLDLSYESLDRLEDYLRLVLEGKVAADRAAVLERVIIYVGATLVEQAGGAWVRAGAGSPPQRPCVTGMPASPRAVFDPAEVVLAFLPRHVGQVRDRTERFDVALQRRRVAELAGDIEGTRHALRKEITVITGRDPGPMDGSASSLDALERALATAEERDDVDREQGRRLFRGAIIYLGWILQQRTGPAAWTVEADERDMHFGWWRIGGWVPEYVVNDVENEPGWLPAAIERQVRKRTGRTRVVGGIERRVRERAGRNG